MSSQVILKISVPVLFCLAFVAKQKESNFAKLVFGGMAIRKAFVLVQTCLTSLEIFLFLVLRYSPK